MPCTRHARLVFAAAIAGAVALGATGATLGYWAFHHAAPEDEAARTFQVQLAPSAPGVYEVYLPVPVRNDNTPPPGFGLHVVAGAPSFGLVETEHGVALRVRAEGPVQLATEGSLPIRLSLDDPRFSFRQFKFWIYLAPDAPGPVLAKVEVREAKHAQDWDRLLDTGRSIVVQEPLDPDGWQVVRATQFFDITVGEGYGAGFPRVALGAVAVTAAAMYLPLGVLALGWVQRRSA